jgi:hypothetical protein
VRLAAPLRVDLGKGIRKANALIVLPPHPFLHSKEGVVKAK